MAAIAQIRIYFRRHWQAWLVLIFMIWRLWHEGLNPRMGIAVGFAIVGLAMNLVVILVNGGMPARVTSDEISDEERPNYHPISSSTRLVWLSDWIPVGNLLISPGDIALVIAMGILLVGSFAGL